MEIVGAYTDNFDGSHIISMDSWTSGEAIFWIDSYDNEADWLVAQNDSDNGFSPDLWSRFEWTIDAADQLWYCQIVFDAASKQDAEAAESPDRGDLEGMGCNGFSWSMLNPE